MGRSHRPRPARLGVKLAQIRDGLGLTLEQMVKRLDYNESPLYPSNVSEFEKNNREPPLKLLLAYSRLVGISTDVLIDDELSLPARIRIHSAKRRAGVARASGKGKR